MPSALAWMSLHPVYGPRSRTARTGFVANIRDFPRTPARSILFLGLRPTTTDKATALNPFPLDRSRHPVGADPRDVWRRVVHEPARRVVGQSEPISPRNSSTGGRSPPTNSATGICRSGILTSSAACRIWAGRKPRSCTRPTGSIWSCRSPAPSISGIALHVFLAGLFTYLWGLRRGLHPVAAVVAGALFMFSGSYFLHVYAGHVSLLYAIAWTPLVFASVEEWIAHANARLGVGRHGRHHHADICRRLSGLLLHGPGGGFACALWIDRFPAPDNGPLWALWGCMPGPLRWAPSSS